MRVQHEGCRSRAAIHGLKDTLTSSSLLGCGTWSHKRVELIRGTKKEIGRANLVRGNLATGVGAGSCAGRTQLWASSGTATPLGLLDFLQERKRGLPWIPSPLSQALYCSDRDLSLALGRAHLRKCLLQAPVGLVQVVVDNDQVKQTGLLA